ncbi:hypothetical protein VTI28DRAFT_1227 [Corynascus sepedonium]
MPTQSRPYPGAARCITWCNHGETTHKMTLPPSHAQGYDLYQIQGHDHLWLPWRRTPISLTLEPEENRPGVRRVETCTRDTALLHASRRNLEVVGGGIFAHEADRGREYFAMTAIRV